MSIKTINPNLHKIDFHPKRGAARIRETVHGPKSLAERVLRSLEERAYGNMFGWPVQSTATITEIVALVVSDYKDNRRKTLKDAKEFQTFWEGECGSSIADDVTGDMLLNRARSWMESGLAPARCNRRIAFLRRGYKLALRKSPPLVKGIPHWSALAESQPRQGFREWSEFLAIRAALPSHAVVPISIEYWTGMRSGEVHDLLWKQVLFTHNKQVAIQLHDSKNGEPRLVLMGGDLYDVMLAWREKTQAENPNCPHVCQYLGRHCKSLSSSWLTACVKVGLGKWTKPKEKSIRNRGYRGALIHDFRRTSVRNNDRAGVPRKVSMAISGHKTESVFLRYRILNTDDLVEAGETIVADHNTRNLAGGQPVDTTTKQKRAKQLQKRK